MHKSLDQSGTINRYKVSIQTPTRSHLSVTVKSLKESQAIGIFKSEFKNADSSSNEASDASLNHESLNQLFKPITPF